MITFHPAARKTSAGFIPMVTLRKDRGRMVGSKVSQGCNVFETASEALAHAVMAASRVVSQYPETMRIAAVAPRYIVETQRRDGSWTNSTRAPIHETFATAQALADDLSANDSPLNPSRVVEYCPADHATFS